MRRRVHWVGAVPAAAEAAVWAKSHARVHAPAHTDEISLAAGTVATVVSRAGDWLTLRHNGKTGLFPVSKRGGYIRSAAMRWQF